MARLRYLVALVVVLWCLASSSLAARGKGNKRGRKQHSTTVTPSHHFLNHDDYSSELFPPRGSRPIDGIHEDDFFAVMNGRGMPDIKTPTHQCEEIRIDACRGIGYNVTSMPNLVGHEQQADAEVLLQSFMPLVQYGCSSQLLFFLCSVHVPMCTEKVPITIGPCRPLCENVKSRCEPVLQGLGFSWPSALNCSKFVEENTVDSMCMTGPDEEHFLPSPKPSDPISVNPTHDFVSNYHQPTHDLVPSVTKTIDSSRKLEIDYKETSGPGRALHSQCREYRHAEQYVHLEHPRNRCVARCGTDVLFTMENKHFVDYWTVVWSSLSLISCLCTILAFIWSPNQYRYPERAIFYITVCYSICAFVYLYRSLLGRETIACYLDPASGESLLVQEGANNVHCTLTFLMLYYFGMAGAAWWLVLAILWSLQLVFGWSLEKLSRQSQLYHTLAWTVPALHTLAALVMRAVDADELTGLCYVGAQNDDNLFYFVILPMTLYLGVGIFNIVTSFLALRLRLFSFFYEECCCCDETNMDESPEGFHNPTADLDTDPSLHSGESGSTSCGDFCRKLCRSGSTRNSLRNGQAGSGQSLLLPSVGQSVVSGNHHFSTVSSTSSYSSSGSKARMAFVSQKPCATEPFLHPANSAQAPLFRPAHSVNRVPHRHRLPRKTTDPKDASLVRTGIFVLFYTLPALCVLAANIYDYVYRHNWLLRSGEEASNHTASSAAQPLRESIESTRPNFEIFNMKLFMSLVIGIKTGLWILTVRSPINSWRCFLSRCFTKKVYPSSGVSVISSQQSSMNHRPVMFRAENGGQTVLAGNVGHFASQHFSGQAPAFNFGAGFMPATNAMGEHYFFVNDHTSTSSAATTTTTTNAVESTNPFHGLVQAPVVTGPLFAGSTLSTTASSSQSNPVVYFTQHSHPQAMVPFARTGNETAV